MYFTYNYFVNSLLWIFLLSTRISSSQAKVTITTWIGLVKACDMFAVNKCVTLLNTTESTNALNEGMAAIPQTEVLDSLCRARQDFKACYDPLSVTCKSNSVFSMTFGVIDATLSYLCTEGYSDILQHESCWNQINVTDGTLMCHSHQKEMFEKLNSRAGFTNITDLRNNWCSILQNTSDCMTDVAAENCGPTPACIMRTMMSRALAGLADIMGCSIRSDCSDMAISPFPKVSVSITTRPPKTNDGLEANGKSNFTRSVPDSVTTNTNSKGNRNKMGSTGNGTQSSMSLINLTLIVVLYMVHLFF